MFYILKNLYYSYKVHKYNQLIIKQTKKRQKLKTKQRSYTIKYEYYLNKNKLSK